MAKAFRRSSWLRILAVLMSIVVLATPAMAGFATAKVLSENLKANGSGCPPCAEIANTIMNHPQLKTLFGGKDPGKSQLGEGKIREVQELTGASLVRVTKSALADPQVKALGEELARRGYVLAEEEVEAATITAEFENTILGKKERVVTTIITLPLLNDANETAMMSFVSNKFGTGAAAVVKEDGTPAMMVYDLTRDQLVVVPLGSLTCWVCKKLWKRSVIYRNGMLVG